MAKKQPQPTKAPANATPRTPVILPPHEVGRYVTQLRVRGEDAPRAEQIGGVIRIKLGDEDNAEVFEIEAYRRAGYPAGLHIRGITCMLDVQPDASNTIIVKPR